MIQLNKVLATCGDGYWSDVVRKVAVIGIDLGYVNDEADFAELRVHFTQASWDCKKHGLIYTDKQFIRLLRGVLTAMGLDGSDVDYSEQGMQGDNYVSCDVGASFLESFKAKYADEFAAAIAE